MMATPLFIDWKIKGSISKERKQKSIVATHFIGDLAQELGIVFMATG